MTTNEELAHFMGTQIGKVFPGYGDEPFRGKVAEIDTSDNDGRCFRIDYEDGDCEWMTLEELLELRVSPDGSGPPTPLGSGRKAARPAGAVKRARGGKPRTPGRDAAARGGSAEVDAARKKRGRPSLAKKMALAAKQDGVTGSGSDKEEEEGAAAGTEDERPGKRARGAVAAAGAAAGDKDASGLSDQEAGKVTAGGDEAAAPAAADKAAAAPPAADKASSAAAGPKAAAAAAAKERSSSPAPAAAATLKKSAAATAAEAKQVASKIAASMRPGNSKKRLAALAGLPQDAVPGDAAAAAGPSTSAAAAAAGAADDATAGAAGSGAEAGGSGASTPLRPNSNAARLLAAAKAQGAKSKLGGRGGSAGEEEDAPLKADAVPAAEAPDETKGKEKQQPQKRQQQQKKQQKEQQQKKKEEDRDEEMKEQPPLPSPEPRETKAPVVKKEAAAAAEAPASATANDSTAPSAAAARRVRPLLPKSSPGMAGGEVAYVTVQPRSVAEAGLSPADVEALRRGDDLEAIHQAYVTATATCLRSAGRLLDQLSAKRSTLLTATVYLRDVENGASGFTEAWNAWLGSCEAPGVMVLQGHGPVPDVPVLLQITAFAADEGDA